MWSVMSTPTISSGQSPTWTDTKVSPPIRRPRPGDSIKQTKIICSSWL